MLKIAEKSKAIVLSNDSFQEFHGDHSWLFEDDRLLGASPVPGVGWIFIPRSPVRGSKSRAAVRGVRNLPPMPKPKTPPPSRRGKAATAEVQVDEKSAVRKTTEVLEQPHRRVATSVAAVNDPTTFITFIASHPLGEVIEAEVESFTSHGAIIRYQNVQCYAPLSGLGNPAPRSAREVLARGEIRGFVIRGLDPQRRGIELALPEVTSKGIHVVPAHPEAEGRERRTRQRVAKKVLAPLGGVEPPLSPAVKSPAKKLAAKKVARGSRPTSTPETAKQTARSTAAKLAPAKKAPSRSVPQKSVAAKSGGAATEVKKSSAPKKAPTSRVSAKQAPGKSVGGKKTISKVVATGKRGSK